MLVSCRRLCWSRLLRPGEGATGEQHHSSCRVGVCVCTHCLRGQTGKGRGPTRRLTGEDQGGSVQLSAELAHGEPRHALNDVPLLDERIRNDKIASLPVRWLTRVRGASKRIDSLIDSLLFVFADIDHCIDGKLCPEPVDEVEQERSNQSLISTQPVVQAPRRSGEEGRATAACLAEIPTPDATFRMTGGVLQRRPFG